MLRCWCHGSYVRFALRVMFTAVAGFVSIVLLSLLVFVVALYIRYKGAEKPPVPLDEDALEKEAG